MRARQTTILTILRLGENFDNPEGVSALRVCPPLAFPFLSGDFTGLPGLRLGVPRCRHGQSVPGSIVMVREALHHFLHQVNPQASQGSGLTWGDIGHGGRFLDGVERPAAVCYLDGDRAFARLYRNVHFRRPAGGLSTVGHDVQADLLTGGVPLDVAFVQPVFHSPASLLNFVPARAGEYLSAVKSGGFDCDDVPFWRHLGGLLVFAIAVLLESVGFDGHPGVRYAGPEGETG